MAFAENVLICVALNATFPFLRLPLWSSAVCVGVATCVIPDILTRCLARTFPLRMLRVKGFVVLLVAVASIVAIAETG